MSLRTNPDRPRRAPRWVPWVLGLLVGGGALMACSRDDDADAGPTTTTDETADAPLTTDDSGPPATDGGSSTDTAPSATTPPFEQGSVVLTELGSPGSLSAMVAHPDSGVVFLALRVGEVVAVDPEVDAVGGRGDEALGSVVLDITADVTAGGERGLLGIAVAPDGAHLYLHYSDREGDTQVDEFALDGTTLDPDSRRSVFSLEQPLGNHNGGELSFGPDGMLYLALGDGGGAGDPFDAGQDPSTLLGTIVRIDPRPDETTDTEGYGIPDDNPFVDGGGAPEVWLFGVRNPWRFSWDRATGELWVADVGQSRVEEVTRLAPTGDGPAGRGANLGWAEMEGDEAYAGGTEPDDHVGPDYVYRHPEGCSITGGYVYRGEAVPSLVGTYIFGDYCTSELWGLRPGDDGTLQRFDLGLSVDTRELVSFGEDLDGELYVLTDSGTLFRLDPA